MALADMGANYPHAGGADLGAPLRGAQRPPRWTHRPLAGALASRWRFSIAHKTFFWLIVQTLIVVVAFSLLVNWAFDKGITEYMSQFNEQRAQDMARELSVEYAKTGSWDALRQNPRRWAAMAMKATGHSVGAKPEDAAKLEALFAEFHEGEFPTALPAPLPLRFVLMDDHERILIGSPRANAAFKKAPIVYDGRRVGLVAFAESPVSTYDLRFRDRFSAALLVIIVGSFLLALAPALFITRLVTRPVQAIGRAARGLADGKTAVQLEIRSNDELGDLGRDFNSLSAALAKHETLQRMWLAELSHELRTPVAILMAETEAMLDEIRPLDRKGIQSLHDESRRLSRLIGDLNQLSLSDFGAIRYAFSLVKPADLIAECIEGLRSRFEARRLDVRIEGGKGRCIVQADPDKLRQVFLNLLENSLRYTDEGGLVRINVAKVADGVTVTFDDSSPSVPEHEIEHLFERLYRGESSRSRKSGGYGLGLAICRSIVEAHDGSIVAAPSQLGGLRFTINLGAGAQ